MNEEEPNPYESPTLPRDEADSDNRRRLVHGSVDFAGTIWSVGLMGAILGGVVAAIMMGLSGHAPASLFFTPAVGWAIATMFAGAMLKYPHQDTLKTALSFLPLVIPAYILYVPVCGVSAVILMGVGGSSSGTGDYLVLLASAFAFGVVLVLVASLMRQYYRHQHEKRMGVGGDMADAKGDPVEEQMGEVP